MTALPAAPVARPKRMRSLAWRRFWRDKAAMTGLILCLLIVLAALLAPWLSPHDPNFQFPDGLSLDGAPQPPGRAFLLGTDLLGRDLLSRLLWGARASLLVGVIANGIAVIIGVLLGALGGLVARRDRHAHHALYRRDDGLSGAAAGHRADGDSAPQFVDRDPGDRAPQLGWRWHVWSTPR